MSKLMKVVAALVSLIVIMVAGFILVRVTGPQNDRIVDCAPGFHNQSGPSSDCVPDGSSK